MCVCVDVSTSGLFYCIVSSEYPLLLKEADAVLARDKYKYIPCTLN